MPAGTKRHRDGSVRERPARDRDRDQDGPRTRFHPMFENFRDDLDEHYDRRERIVKASRDVTAQSKKIIFALQRVKQINQGLPPSTEKDVTSRMAEITKLLQSISPDVQSINRYRYAQSLRCLEELVEALSFAHYLRHQKLITLEETAASTPGDIALTPHDYMFGIFDLFGEMMRFATVTTAQNGEMPGGEDGRNILCDIQELACAFEMLRQVPTKEYWGKMEAMRQSVQKVERLGYGLAVRGSERPKGWVPDMKDYMDGGSP
ncbi:translin-associated protein X [Metarhizium album ARSEF 1941]|uniref:Translin-associated protein X n=1 Tax=Metarhizium album (strain ARSEF 1941) TaxID=1081103 RepID=A0A0B2WLG0_METAS|nr:translin-associated protein X [Metarhizium album ARSEF 1941]KHN94534.1 translin-associated protein X [Metarhizium album ARSEF 1941]